MSIFSKLRLSQSKSQNFFLVCETSQADSKINMKKQKAKKRQNPINEGQGVATCSTRY